MEPANVPVGVMTVDGVTTGAVIIVVRKCEVAKLGLPSVPVVEKTVCPLVTSVVDAKVVGFPTDVIGAAV